MKADESVLIQAEKLHWHGDKDEGKKFSHIFILKMAILFGCSNSFGITWWETAKV